MVRPVMKYSSSFQNPPYASMTTSPLKMLTGVLIWDAVSPMQIARVPRLNHTRPSLSDVRRIGSSTSTTQAAVTTSNSGRMRKRSPAEKVMAVGSPMQ